MSTKTETPTEVVNVLALRRFTCNGVERTAGEPFRVTDGKLLLRLTEGAVICVFNGRDGEWETTLAVSNRKSVTLIARQMKGPGSLISFELKAGLPAGKMLLESLKVATLAVSLGGVETLIQHPASMTHAAMKRENRIAAGITDGLVRLSVGCEGKEDLLADLRQGLDGLIE